MNTVAMVIGYTVIALGSIHLIALGVWHLACRWYEMHREFVDVFMVIRVVKRMKRRQQWRFENRSKL